MNNPQDSLDEKYRAVLPVEDSAFLAEGWTPAKKATPAKKQAQVPQIPKKSPAPERKEPVEAVPQVDPNTLAPAGNDKTSPAHAAVAAVEARFLEVAGLTGDLRHFPIDGDRDLRQLPIDKTNDLQVKTDKSKSDRHGEVFTPLWLVDQMIERVANAELKDQSKTTMDLCSGYGQFSLRLLRRKLNLLGARFNVDRFLGETHAFVELQAGSCFKLLYIFGTGIRLCIGDAAKMGQLPDAAETGIWVWCQADSKWKDMTAKIIKKFNKTMEGGYGPDKAEKFEDWFEGLQARKNSGGRSGAV